MFRKNMISEILNYDPLVSDTACQNRAIALVALARKVSKGKGLSSEEMSFLDGCALLSLAKDVDRNAFGLIEKEVTNGKKIPDSYFLGADKITNGMRNELLAATKQLVAEQAIQIMRQKCVLQFDDTFRFYETTVAGIKLQSKDIPIFPVYLTAKYLLQYIDKRKVPVLIKLTRLSRNIENGEKTKVGDGLFYYFNRKIRPADRDALQGKPEDGVIVFDLISETDNKPEKPAMLFGEANFDDFSQSFVSQNFNLLIMLCAAVHDPYPKNIICDDNDPMKNPIAPICSLNAEELSLKRCSLPEYRKLQGVASQYGFFNKCLSVDHISTTTVASCRELVKGPI